MTRTVDPDMLGMAHLFVVSIDNASYDFGSWSKAAGLSVKWDVCEHRTGDQGNAVQVYPGHTKYERIRLSRAACQDSATVQQWLATTSVNCVPLSGAISMMSFVAGSAVRVPIVTWTLREFFPVGWSVSDFEASANGSVAIETLELVHTGFLADQTSGSTLL